MTLTILRKREINKHYNYIAQDQQGNKHTLKGLKENYNINSTINLNIEINNAIHDTETVQDIKEDYDSRTFGMTRKEITEHMNTVKPINKQHELYLLMLAHKRNNN